MMSLTRSVVVLLTCSVLALTGTVAGLALGLTHGPCGSGSVDVRAGSPDELSLTFVGDTMLGDAARSTLETQGYDWPFDGVKGLLLESDFTIANAEGPITTRTDPFDPSESWTYNADPASAQAIHDAGVDALNLANNHTMDRGGDGLADTIAAASRAGMVTVGAGRDACEAELPLLIRGNGQTVAIVSLANYYGRAKTASTAGPGTIALARQSIRRGISLARAQGATSVVAYVHWGENYKGANDLQRDLAREFAAAGYDLVVGTHPHVTQGIEMVERMPVAYSIGNFVFGSAGRYPADRPGVGIILSATFGKLGLSRLNLRCIVTDNDIVQFQPRPCDSAQAASVLDGLSPDVIVDGDEGVLDLTSR